MVPLLFEYSDDMGTFLVSEYLERIGFQRIDNIFGLEPADTDITPRHGDNLPLVADNRPADEMDRRVVGDTFGDALIRDPFLADDIGPRTHHAIYRLG